MNKNNILIVEDEVKTNQFLCEYMEIYFDKVYSAYDGEKALDLYYEHKPDVIFTDINMPKLNGLDLANKIREEDRETIIVVLSAHTDKEKLFKAIELQLLTYLVKPIKSTELKETVLNIKSRLNNDNVVHIKESIYFSLNLSQLVIDDEEVELTLYEKRFLNLLLQRQGICVPYDDISSYVYDINEFSKDSISSLVKRLRKKLGSDVIINCFNEGYKIQKGD